MSEKKYLLRFWVLLGSLFFLSFIFLFSFLTFKSLSSTLNSERFWFFNIWVLVCVLFWGLGWRNQKYIKISKTSINIIESIPLVIRRIIIGVTLFLPGTIYLFIQIPYQQVTYFFRVMFSIMCVVFILLFNNAGESGKKLIKKGMLYFLFIAFIFSLFSILNHVTDYPFSLFWSEGNRIWDYSILFGEGRYLVDSTEPLYAFTSQARSFLWSLAFLIPGLKIQSYRLWDALVKTLPQLIFVAILIWNERKRIGKVGTFIFITWGFVFLAQGSIYAHIMLPAIITILAVKNKKIFISIILVGFAAYFAQIDRLHWAFAPGLWAGLYSLLLISDPKLSFKNWKQLNKPVLLGLAGLFGGVLIPIGINFLQNSGGGSEAFSSIPSAFSQVLLWDRLLPNLTYGFGIILGITFAALPLYLLIVLLARKRVWKFNRFQNMCIAIIAVAFLVVGLIASTKIGGGADLHNLDLFILVSVIVLSTASDFWGWISNNGINFSWAGLIICVFFIFPSLYMFRSGNRLLLPQANEIDGILAAIQEAADDTWESGGEILFMDQRQLITFDLIQNVKMIDDFDKKVLINELFHPDSNYIDGFHQDIQNQRFMYIVSDPIREFRSEADFSTFADEEYLWWEWVEIPLLENYVVIFESFEPSVFILAPRGEESD